MLIFNLTIQKTIEMIFEFFYIIEIKKREIKHMIGS